MTRRHRYALEKHKNALDATWSGEEIAVSGGAVSCPAAAAGTYRLIVRTAVGFAAPILVTSKLEASPAGELAPGGGPGFVVAGKGFAPGRTTLMIGDQWCADVVATCGEPPPKERARLPSFPRRAASPLGTIS